MTSNEIRTAYLEFFRSKGHEIVPGSPLIPANDPTLLFTNSGMVQFKELFLGNEQRAYTRAATAQRCIRAGGKHNDLDNVGYTARHHTFFEMLGNFSFGDYFKREAIQYAWEFLTVVMKIPQERLWITVFEDDNEAADIWLKEIGVSDKRLSRCGEKDNFWAMGDTGPCGPCSEIFYDHGPEIAGGPPGSPDADGDRYVEIWNLVFTQYDRSKDGTLKAIPKPSVDTGMGLERIAALLQGVHNNYDIDTFSRIIAAIRSLPGFDGNKHAVSQRVIADHIRSCAFLVADGVVPSNEGRGYVLRRIIRRAIRHGNKIGFTGPFFHKLVPALIEVMGDTAAVLRERSDFVQRTLKQEEDRFAETLEHGLKHMEDALAKMSGDTLSGDVIFKLYDTYGFPVDLTADIARERNFHLDMTGFEQAMEQQRTRARAASKFGVEMSVNDGSVNYQTTFTGYDSLTGSAVVTALYRDGAVVNEIHAGDQAGIILESTPFYAESGGQVGDVGQLLGSGIVFTVIDTQKQGKAFVHLGKLEQGTIKVGVSLQNAVDSARRLDIIRNHSATHLLHAALRHVLGNHVTQKGSLVAPDRLRFDFSQPEALTEAQINTIETMVNRKILENRATQIQVMGLEQAKKSGAMSLFGEKYEAEVRVLTIADGFSVELCGGTHVGHTGDIGLFKLVSETGVAAGVRRIEAVTGLAALQWVHDSESRITRLARLLKADQGSVEARLEQLLDRARKQEKEIEKLKSTLASNSGGDMVSEAVEIGGIRVLAKSLPGTDAKSLRETVDQLKNKLGSAAIVLATVEGDKVSLIAGVTKDATGRIQAGDLVNFVALQVGGRGGGRADMAQAGGTDPSGLEAALLQVPDWVKQKLSA
jgi:alanyl-tRNA synthetase